MMDVDHTQLCNQVKVRATSQALASSPLLKHIVAGTQAPRRSFELRDERARGAIHARRDDRSTRQPGSTETHPRTYLCRMGSWQGVRPRVVLSEGRGHGGKDGWVRYVVSREARYEIGSSRSDVLIMLMSCGCTTPVPGNCRSYYDRVLVPRKSLDTVDEILASCET